MTANPDAIERYYWLPAHAQLLTAMSKVKGRFELGVRRQPELEARLPGLVAKAHEQLELELPKDGPKA